MFHLFFFRPTNFPFNKPESNFPYTKDDGVINDNQVDSYVEGLYKFVQKLKQTDPNIIISFSPRASDLVDTRGKAIKQGKLLEKIRDTPNSYIIDMLNPQFYNEPLGNNSIENSAGNPGQNVSAMMTGLRKLAPYTRIQMGVLAETQNPKSLDGEANMGSASSALVQSLWNKYTTNFDGLMTWVINLESGNRGAPRS